MRITIPNVRVHHPTGNKLICYCPFHKGGQERSPSMEIQLDKSRWRCFTCATGWKPLMSLLTEHGGLSREEARRKVDDLKALAVQEQVKRVDRVPCPEYLLGQYLNRRPMNLIKAGFAREILDEMEVGWDGERFRVVYPIRDVQGALLGVVGGAVLSKDDDGYVAYYGNAPKYWAYGTHEGFPYQVNPKWSLWNYYRVADSEDPSPIVVVEGFKALMWVRMAGVRNVVATCGAPVAGSQVELLAGLRGPFLVFLDNDETGKSASRMLTADLRRRTNGVRIVKYPRDVRQPDDLTINEVRQTLGVSDADDYQPRQDRDQEDPSLETDRPRPV
ncbi:MAG: hypothetical protein GYA36_19705 [Veillonellaceae bacterium]|nr:hypothetical protein [Veillonellaceae bacterium]